ncbi:MAG: hypothetical protein J7M26_00760, partial [Armatimonadetes bacterium]|nr:hypothetical protein [Armatimonadota bacterium]
MTYAAMVGLGLLLGLGLTQAQDRLDLAPQPKVVRDEGTDLALGKDTVAIVLGDRATEPERYAAERLQTLVERRFGVRWPVYTETTVPDRVSQPILLGQLDTNARLRRACEGSHLPWWRDVPPLDAYTLRIGEGRDGLLVRGSNPRSVIYGAQTLFKLLKRKNGRLVLPRVLIQDWPSIPWRGRPHGGVAVHLKPGVLDAYLWAGLNFIDVRAGAFGYGPDAKLDREQIAECLRQAHRRGMFVYGTVSCGVKPDKFDGALRVFRQLIELGVDGLWISFDDPGGGESTTELAARAVELGKQYGIEGRAIATTPPSGSYQKILTDFNRQMVKVPGMADATWFFTRNPCAADREAARELGLHRLPAWWHNWPRTEAGFTHGSYGGASFRQGGKPSYMEVPPLTWGWHNPKYEALRDAARNTDTVMMWGGWPPEYTSAVLGIWAWSPQTHDFAATRRAIYETVFGAGNVERMVKFDDDLHELKSLFLLPARSPDPNNNFPPRLKPDADRERVRALISEMTGLYETIAATAPEQSLLDRDRLASEFLEPMHAELSTAAALAAIKERPEDWWPEHEAKVLARLAAGDLEGLGKLVAEARPRIEAEVEE